MISDLKVLLIKGPIFDPNLKCLSLTEHFIFALSLLIPVIEI